MRANEGPDSLLNLAHLYEPSKHRVVGPNGAMVTLYSAGRARQLGVPAPSMAMDELATWPSRDGFEQAMFGLRLGKNPRTVIATTPGPHRSSESGRAS